METLRICGILLQPMMPSLANKLLDRLAVPSNERYYKNLEQLFANSEDFKLGTNPGHLISPHSHCHQIMTDVRKAAQGIQKQ